MRGFYTLGPLGVLSYHLIIGYVDSICWFHLCQLRHPVQRLHLDFKLSLTFKPFEASHHGSHNNTDKGLGKGELLDGYWCYWKGHGPSVGSILKWQGWDFRGGNAWVLMIDSSFERGFIRTLCVMFQVCFGLGPMPPLRTIWICMSFPCT